MTDGALRFVPLTDSISTFHAEEIVPAGDQGCNDLTLKAHGTVTAAFSAGARGRGGGGRRGRRVAQNPGEMRAWQGGHIAAVSRETGGAPVKITTHPWG